MNRKSLALRENNTLRKSAREKKASLNPNTQTLVEFSKGRALLGQINLSAKMEDETNERGYLYGTGTKGKMDGIVCFSYTLRQ